MITDIKSLINNILVLNPDSKIKQDDTPPKTNADARVTITCDISDLKLPGGCYIDEDGNITNKIVDSIPYVTLEVVTLKKAETIEEYIDEEVDKLNEKYPNIVSEEQKESAKEIFKNSSESLEDQEKEVDLIVQKTTIDYLEKYTSNIPREPKITEARQKQKEAKNNIKLKMTPSEKNIFDVLKIKKKIQREKVKPVVVKPKKVKKPSKILSSKGFTNVMYISVVIIVILVVYIIIMEV